MDKVKNEVWKPYPEFSFIEVSSLGRVRTLDRVVTRGNGKLLIKGRILKQQRNGGGYLQVWFKVNGKNVDKSVHRLVAQTFISNPDGLPQVNHRDCDRTNNCADNLEWCDASYNARYREKYGVSAAEAWGHPMFAINLNTSEVLCFKSQSEASRMLGVGMGNINNVVKGRRKQAGGYWFTEDSSIEAIKNDKDKLRNIVAGKVSDYSIFAINLTTLEVLHFSSRSEASRALRINIGNLNNVVKGQRNQAGGYWFTNADNKAIKATRCKFGSEVADKVEELMNVNGMQPA